MKTLRHATFAALVATLVGTYTALVGPSLGRLRLESTERLLVPLTLIAAVVALPAFSALRRDARWPVQILILYAGFVLTCLLYGGFMWATGADGTPLFLLTAVVAGHVLGMPLFLVLVLVHLGLARLGFYDDPAAG